MEINFEKKTAAILIFENNNVLKFTNNIALKSVFFFLLAE